MCNDSRPDLVVEVASKLIDDLPMVVDELSTAVRERDEVAFMLWAYTLKGLSSNLQICKLEQLVETLEIQYGRMPEQRQEQVLQQIHFESNRLAVLS